MTEMQPAALDVAGAARLEQLRASLAVGAPAVALKCGPEQWPAS